MKLVKTLLVIVLAVGLIGIAFLFSGIYNIGANDLHTPMVYRSLTTLRDRSIAVRVKSIEVPNLDDPAMIRQGAGNYHAMCTGCHLMPGMASSEMYAGLYPQPPNLSQVRVDPQRAFWVIKNGIKASGMPSWGVSMTDPYLWGLVAFQQKLPDLTAAQYRELVATSGGHDHGGSETNTNITGGHSSGETGGHAHAEGEVSEAHSHGEATDMPGEADMNGMDMKDHDMPMEGESAPPARGEALASDGHAHSHGEEADEAMPMKETAEPIRQADGHAHAHGPKAQSEAAPRAAGMNAPAEPAATVAAFERALVRGDLDAADALLEPDVLIFEGGGIERSRQEYAEGHMKHDAEFLKSATIKLLSQSGDGIGDMAWIGSERTMGALREGKPTDIVSTETMVLRRRADGWRIAHIHWSSRAAKAGH